MTQAQHRHTAHILTVITNAKNMTKTKILIILLSLFSCSIFGQTNYLKQIEKGKYVKAEKKLNKALKKEPNDIVLNYGMSSLLMKRKHKGYNI